MLFKYTGVTRLESQWNMIVPRTGNSSKLTEGMGGGGERGTGLPEAKTKKQLSQ